MPGRSLRGMIVWMLLATVSSLPLAAAHQQVIGHVVSSPRASLDGIIVPGEGTLFSGDTVTTEKGGGALVQLSPAIRASLSEETSVRFKTTEGQVWAQISSGTLVTETDSKSALVVETPKYKINPTTQGKAVYVVTMLPDKDTLVATRSGQISITEISSNQSYLLSQGQYAQIPALSSGVPRQAVGKVEAAQSAHGKIDSPDWHIGSLSHDASIILVAAIAAGTAAAIAIPLSTGGGAASPSKP